MTVTPAEDVLATAIRLVALACAYWLLFSTLLYTAAAAARLPGAVRAVEWATLPVVRRLADRAVAVTLVTSSVVGASATAGFALPAVVPPAVGAGGVAAGTDRGPVPPPAARRPAALPEIPPPDRPSSPDDRARADEQPPAAAPREDAGEDGDTAHDDTDAGQADGEDRSQSGAADPEPAETDEAQPGAADGEEALYVVELGDNLWSITASHLEAMGDAGDDSAVYEVWVAVIDENRDRLRSGDPDLIYPGETITISALPEPGAASATPAG